MPVDHVFGVRRPGAVVAVIGALVGGMLGLGCESEKQEVAVAPSDDAAPEAAEVAPKGDVPMRSYGEPITVDAVTPLDAIKGDPAKYADTPIKTQGVVTAVCKSKGCWMEIGDEEGKAFIKMAGHSFFVPIDSKGHRANVQGTLVMGESVDTCHQKDGCRENAEAATGEIAKLEIVATGVEFLD